MKTSLLFIQIMCLLFFFERSFSQNVMLNVSTQNSGIVKIDSTIFFEVTVSNTSPTTQIPAYKLRAQISFPISIILAPDMGHILPKGWSIQSDKNRVMILSNGTDVIPANGNRTILIALKGKTVGGPSTISGTLTFSDGIAPGYVVGKATIGDNMGDNTSSSTVTVLK
jgi:hypothetical protein